MLAIREKLENFASFALEAVCNRDQVPWHSIIFTQQTLQLPPTLPNAHGPNDNSRTDDARAVQHRKLSTRRSYRAKDIWGRSPQLFKRGLTKSK